MKRAERLRQYWEERIPKIPALYLSDIAPYTRGVASLRTLQRRAADWSLPVIGGPDRAVREYRVLREDLIDFLCNLDQLTGSKPEGQPVAEEPPPAPPPAARRIPPKPPEQLRTDQRSLFDE